MKEAVELNLDGLVGPTHHYGGLAFGNIASMTHAKQRSHPRLAALQGLQKMKLLTDLGIPQAVLPPHERPDISLLRACGFTGKDAEVLSQTAKQAPWLLNAASSSAAMWAANAASITPSPDTEDQRLHITPANLLSYLHRRGEAETNRRIFQKLFASPEHFAIHFPLPACEQLADEGAANHTRLAPAYCKPALHLYVYGCSKRAKQLPARFPARQTLEASECIARQHRQKKPALFIQQNPQAIDAGVFHNDVISIGNEQLFFYHERAFLDTERAVRAIKQAYSQISKEPLQLLCVKEEELSLQEAVRTYLFNSQIATLPDNSMALIAPIEVHEHRRANALVHSIIEKQNPIKSIYYVDLRQSMENGGGPACLRLRIVLKAEELAAMHPGVLLTDSLYRKLIDWINTWYREELKAEDLSDPLLLEEARSALDSLTKLLQLGNVYAFQVV